MGWNGKENSGRAAAPMVGGLEIGATCPEPEPKPDPEPEPEPEPRSQSQSQSQSHGMKQDIGECNTLAGALSSWSGVES
jgi:hypothetical protein